MFFFHVLSCVRVRFNSREQLCVLYGYPGSRTTWVCMREETDTRPRIRVVDQKKSKYIRLQRITDGVELYNAYSTMPDLLWTGQQDTAKQNISFF